MVTCLNFAQTQLGHHALVQLQGVSCFEQVQHFHTGVLVLNQRHQGLAQAIQIPKRHLRLSCKRIATLVIGVVANMGGIETI